MIKRLLDLEMNSSIYNRDSKCRTGFMLRIDTGPLWIFISWFNDHAARWVWYMRVWVWVWHYREITSSFISTLKKFTILPFNSKIDRYLALDKTIEKMKQSLHVSNESWVRFSGPTLLWTFKLVADRANCGHLRKVFSKRFDYSCAIFVSPPKNTGQITSKVRQQFTFLRQNIKLALPLWKSRFLSTSDTPNPLLVALRMK